MIEKLNKILGISFGAVGIFLLLYAGYFYFFLSNEKNIIQLLPSKNFEFIAFGSENSENIPKSILDNISFYIPKNNAVVAYFNPEKKRSEFIIISTKPDFLENKSGLLCNIYKKYELCTNTENVDTFKNVQEFVNSKNSKENNKSLQNIAYLISSSENSIENIVDKNANISFFGTTQFLLKNIEKIPADIQIETVTNVLSLSQENLLYFSGKSKNNKFSVKFYKTDEKSENIFITSQKSFLLSEISLINENTENNINNFLYISHPQKIFDYLTNNNISVHFVENISQYFTFRTFFNDMFHGEISYFNDIEPLLSGNIVIADDFIGVELSSESVAKEFYNTYYTVLKNYTSRAHPEKECFTLSDESEACEVFPSDENVEIIEKNGENKEFSSFISEEKFYEDKQIYAYLVRKNNIIFLANAQTDLLENIFERNQKFPNNSEVFLHFDHASLEMKNESVRVVGKEEKENIEFTLTFN